MKIAVATEMVARHPGMREVMLEALPDARLNETGSVSARPSSSSSCAARSRDHRLRAGHRTRARRDARSQDHQQIRQRLREHRFPGSQAAWNPLRLYLGGEPARGCRADALHDAGRAALDHAAQCRDARRRAPALPQRPFLSGRVVGITAAAISARRSRGCCARSVARSSPATSGTIRISTARTP